MWNVHPIHRYTVGDMVWYTFPGVNPDLPEEYILNVIDI